MIWVGFIINSWVHLYFLNQCTFKFKHSIRSSHFDAVPNRYFEISWEKMSKHDVILIILIYLEHNKAMCYYLGHVNTESNLKCNLSMEKVIANRNRSVEKSFNLVVFALVVHSCMTKNLSFSRRVRYSS